MSRLSRIRGEQRAARIPAAALLPVLLSAGAAPAVAQETGRAPLQLGVFKNRLAMELAASARQARRSLAAGKPQEAVKVLTWLRDLLQGMRHEIAGWSSDPDLLNDLAMVGEYLEMLGSPLMADARERSLLADSLHYAAHRRLLSVTR